MFNECGFDISKQFGVFSEYLIEAEHGFVGEVGFVQFIEGVDVNKQSFADFGKSQSYVCEYLDCFSGHLEVYVCSVIVKFVEQISQVVLVGQFTHNSDFDGFDVGGFVEFAVEVLEVFFEVAFASHM